MRLVTFVPPSAVAIPRPGAVVTLDPSDPSPAALPDSSLVLDLAQLARHRASRHPRAAHLFTDLPPTLSDLFVWRPNALNRVRDLIDSVADEPAEDLIAAGVAYPLSAVQLTAPIPAPPTIRDFYAFEEHVRRARSLRNLGMVPEWYEFPAFYYSNPGNVLGLDSIVARPAYTQALDYELEIAAIVGRPGRDLTPDQAEEFIAGYAILNDWSARDVQRGEMAVGLGPAKAKDFATSLGPYVVTPDELADRRSGRGYDLAMAARVNGIETSHGNWAAIHWSFGQMLARASAGVWLRPGDVVGSGTVGTGCLLERPPEERRWLQPGDVVELEIERLGVLRNTVGE
ncbi:MAG: fumarylacetoacetate hydrolase family protein [Chloroflexi bacterium]|nr:fumarylacetoacetate hydrolase family protein [Chloroflexota bacterium]